MKILFLGDRRIAQTALDLIFDKFNETISVCGVVSSKAFYEEVVLTHIQSSPPPFISNLERNEDEIRRLIERTLPDYLISIQHVWRIPLDIIQSVGGKAINLHNAKLPNYKGYYSINHSIANGDSEYTTTIHWMADEVDVGDIAYEAVSPINNDDTALSVYLKTVEGSRKILFELFSDMVLGKVKKKMLSKGGKFYKKNSINALRYIGKSVSEDAINKIARACYFPPYEPAYFLINGIKFYITPENVRDILSSANPANEHEKQ